MATVRIAYLALDVPGFQYARPDTDVSVGLWHRYPPPDIYYNRAVNETTASDEEYIYSDPTPTDDTIELGMSSIDQPVNRTVTLYIRGSRG